MSRPNYARIILTRRGGDVALPDELFDEAGIADGEQCLLEIRPVRFWDRYESRRVGEGDLVDFSEYLGLASVPELEELAERDPELVERRWREFFPCQARVE